MSRRVEFGVQIADLSQGDYKHTHPCLERIREQSVGGSAEDDVHGWKKSKLSYTAMKGRDKADVRSSAVCFVKKQEGGFMFLCKPHFHILWSTAYAYFSIVNRRLQLRNHLPCEKPRRNTR